ncbi:hypothetical protein, conserved [Trypanosoma cruzi]|uniref:Uncharacterized protein n=1 Tax=Trypanosoma cruzi (strain CL Brener) TaxID=353153 RepID=Q4DW35_TRYCC|nr:uncharacterized protein Tc00.1047053507681.189 [Trypanosoma cruzi]EAN96751.1 hypothetical protein, conserved [Trypanosoma cruzi]|eukprot:XP_818602.1 hypothetical protein [Trypanosoma cruzi strain CL Brener]
MATAQELQQQLEDLRSRHEEEVKRETAVFEEINKEMMEMQEVTERLEKEERQLEGRLGTGDRGAGEGQGEVSSLLSNIALGLVDPDDSNSRRR